MPWMAMSVLKKELTYRIHNSKAEKKDRIMHRYAAWACMADEVSLVTTVAGYARKGTPFVVLEENLGAWSL